MTPCAQSCIIVLFYMFSTVLPWQSSHHETATLATLNWIIKIRFIFFPVKLYLAKLSDGGKCQNNVCVSCEISWTITIHAKKVTHMALYHFKRSHVLIFFKLAQTSVICRYKSAHVSTNVLRFHLSRVVYIPLQAEMNVQLKGYNIKRECNVKTKSDQVIITNHATKQVPQI